MKISPKWLAAVFVYVAAEVCKHYGFYPADAAYQFAFQGAEYLIIGLIAWWNRTHTAQIQTQEEPAAEAPKSYNDMLPYISAVHNNINRIYADVQSGKANQATLEAIDTYMKMYAVLKEKGAVEDAAKKTG